MVGFLIYQCDDCKGIFKTGNLWEKPKGWTISVPIVGDLKLDEKFEEIMGNFPKRTAVVTTEDETLCEHCFEKKYIRSKIGGK